MNTETMTSWQDFLAQHGHQSSAPVWQSAALQSGFVAALTDQALLLATGEDAPTFLHNQLTNDVEHLESDQARLACYCSPKGRMIASILYWKTGEGIVLQLHHSIKAAIHKRLQMFILRAKAKLLDISLDQVVLGIGGAAAAGVLSRWFPALPQQTYAKIDNQFGSLIRVSDASTSARYQWITTNAIAQDIWPILSKELSAVDASAWRLTEIQAGIPQIVDKTQDQFVPQMVNFELIGGVNFKKGCYPGQEIVARSQYLGKLKRRMALARIAHQGDQPIAPGTEVFTAEEAGQPCGMIVNAELVEAGQCLCLVEIKVADQEAGTIHLASAAGPVLVFLALPYPVIDVTA
ncbi:folate-binding protein [Undibacterium sp. Jales W-56]|uniref:CAF17-like 4Fe-4S cluster assembly/insertion protein YgfZ n=1 Tax=Undibacterium sp. Jales W-56 TaxID=2897325 RepID=UPI0021CEA305|nr:folate-binding protein [Undibacterium sp. Jales W-56]MCU6433387.1 folate-binding protein [Undibacterium sp. Jales W-56]